MVGGKGEAGGEHVGVCGKLNMETLIHAHQYSDGYLVVEKGVLSCCHSVVSPL